MINFGTDGWRGIIADDFTVENVRLVTQAVCDYVLGAKAGGSREKPGLIIGYDTRFLSDLFAREAACVAAANGIGVLLAEQAAPTPAVSYAVVDNKADGAIMFTASHNPYRYNGLKFKASFGGSAGPEITSAIEKHLAKNTAAGKEPLIESYETAAQTGLITMFDPKPRYLKRLGELVDTGVIAGKRQRVVVDPMYGAGRGYLSEFLRGAGCDVIEIHDTRDPYFGGGRPEPLGQHLGDLMDAVRDEAVMGIALDGDADRIGAVDANGEFVSSHQIIALLLRYLHQEKGYTGDVVKTVSTTGMVDILAAEYGLVLHETPIGFKYICDKMLACDVLIGGEESGGIGVKGHIPERDGMLMGALLVEMTSHYGRDLNELWQELQEAYGYFHYDRVDLVVDADSRSDMMAFLNEYTPGEIEGIAVKARKTDDGFKFCLADDSWLMIRPSGTEPVVRVYCESGTPEQVKSLLAAGVGILGRFTADPEKQ